jgi:hypothetical protein
MEKLIERFVCNNTRCYTCGGLVYAVEKKKTTNHVRKLSNLKLILFNSS